MKQLADILSNIETADAESMNEYMSFMDEQYGEQSRPRVGIFWYSPIVKELFGVVSNDAAEQAKKETKHNSVSCKELHKGVWKKNYNYYKFHDEPGSAMRKLFSGDYKDTPRGRVFYIKNRDEYDIMVGHWINDCPEAIEKIKEEFNLTDKNLVVNVKYGIHWEIGMGYGD